MKKILFVIAAYNDYRQEIFDKYISPRNKKYCEIHGFQYVEIRSEHNLTAFRGSHTWNKWLVIRDLIDAGKLQNDDIIINIDADQFIVKPEIDLTTKKSFSYAIDSCNSHCNSLISFKINNWTKDLINGILSDERWERLKNEPSYHEGFPGKYDSFAQEFREQCMMYKLFGIKRHSNIPFWNLPNNGWHSEVTRDTTFSIEDLNEHVEIWPSCYNVTSFEGEHEAMFFMNKCKKEDVVTRHFAGGQDWNLIKNWLLELKDEAYTNYVNEYKKVK